MSEHMEAHTLASLLAEIVRGCPKEDSNFTDQPEFDEVWDEAFAGVEAIRAQNPDAQFEIPNEVPEPDDYQPEEGDEPEKPAVENLKAKTAEPSAVESLKTKTVE